MKRAAIVFTAIAFFAIVFGAINKISGNWFTEMAEAILVGWIAFPATTLPQMSADWPAIWVGIGAVALLPIVLHRLARRWLPWKFRWSLGIVSVVLLMFIAGVSVVGMLHQVAWLIFSDRPIIVQGGRFGTLERHEWENNLMFTAMFVHTYHDSMKRFPGGGPVTPDGRLLHSWETQLLPYFYDTRTIDRNIPWNDPSNEKNFRGVIREFVNPAFAQHRWTADGFGASHIAANKWVISSEKPMTLKDVTDSKSTTILLGGINDRFPAWGNPVNWRDPSTGINKSPIGFGGPPGAKGVHFAMVDGTVRFISNDVSPAVLRALSTPRGGEVIVESDLEVQKEP